MIGGSAVDVDDEAASLSMTSLTASAASDPSSAKTSRRSCFVLGSLGYAMRPRRALV